jgi:hypothetical protein
VVTALGDLQDAQNDFLSVWVNYEVQRLNLDLDLGTMRLDAEGIWLDPGPMGGEHGFALPEWDTWCDEPILVPQQPPQLLPESDGLPGQEWIPHGDPLPLPANPSEASAERWEPGEQDAQGGPPVARHMGARFIRERLPRDAVVPASFSVGGLPATPIADREPPPGQLFRTRDRHRESGFFPLPEPRGTISPSRLPKP